MAARTASGLAAQVKAGNRDLAGVGGEQGGEDLHGGGLACAVWAEQREDGAFGDVQVDPVEDDLVTERLAQARGPDGGSVGCGCGGHWVPPCFKPPGRGGY